MINKDVIIIIGLIIIIVFSGFVISERIVSNINNKLEETRYEYSIRKSFCLEHGYDEMLYRPALQWAQCRGLINDYWEERNFYCREYKGKDVCAWAG